MYQKKIPPNIVIQKILWYDDVESVKHSNCC